MSIEAGVTGAVAYGATRSRIGRLATMLLFATPAVLAHHSVATYDMDKSLTLTALVTEVHWVNPHAFLDMAVTGPDGKQTTWSILAGTPTLNIRKGWKYTDVKQGDKVTVVVHPDRDEEKHAGILQRITLADGRTISGPSEFLGGPAKAPPKQ